MKFLSLAILTATLGLVNSELLSQMSLAKRAWHVLRGTPSCLNYGEEGALCLGSGCPPCWQKSPSNAEYYSCYPYENEKSMTCKSGRFDFNKEPLKAKSKRSTLARRYLKLKR